MAQEYAGGSTVLLEGMYKGVEGRLEDVRQSVSKELQFSSAQQLAAYEALTGALEKGVETILAELKYLSQQSSAIYESDQKDRKTNKEAILESVTAQTEEHVRAYTEKTDAFGKSVEALIGQELSRLKEELFAKLAESLKQTEETAAEKAAQYGETERRLLETAQEANARAAAAEEKLDGLLSRLEALGEKSDELLSRLEAGQAAAGTQPEQAEQAEEAAAEPEKSVVPEGSTLSEVFDYEVLAEKIATVLPETDYDLIADKVAAALPQVDENALADKVAAAVPQFDENAVADKVAETIPPTDYDLIAERVVAAFEREVSLNGESAEKIAAGVEEKLDYERIAQRVAQLLSANALTLSASAPEEIAVTAVKREAEQAVPAPRPAPLKPVAVVTPPDDLHTTRLKRSFAAKIIESEEGVKSFYSELKNELLSYAKVTSQINWANDRFSFAHETVAKIGVRGKTLCLYLALNPDEFPETVYHQKFAGDTKMYEKTPMMVKIKSGVALKRAIRLVGLLLERSGAVKEERKPVDYAAQYAYRSEEQLLAEGLIKTAIIDKSEADYVKR